MLFHAYLQCPTKRTITYLRLCTKTNTYTNIPTRSQLLSYGSSPFFFICLVLVERCKKHLRTRFTTKYVTRTCSYIYDISHSPAFLFL